MIRYTGIGTLVVLIAVMSIVGIFSGFQMEKDFHSIETVHRVQLSYVDSLLGKFVEVQGLLARFVIEDQTDADPLLKRVDSLEKNSESLVSVFHREEHRKLMKQINLKLKEYRSAMVAYSRELQVQRTFEAVRTRERTLLEIENEFRAAITQLKDSIREEISLHMTSIIRQSRETETLNVILGLIGIFSGLTVAFLLKRTLSGPIKELDHALNAAAGGDLKQRVHVETDDEIGQLAYSFNKMADALKKWTAELLESNKSLEKEITEHKRAGEALRKNRESMKKDRDNLRSALDIFSEIIKEVEKKKGFGVCCFNPVANPNVPVCWEMKNCSYRECPVYGRKNVRCWQIAGTHCGGEVQGKFAKKFGACEKCEVYQETIKDPKYEICETFNNMMHMLEITQRELIKAQHSAEEASKFKSEFLANMSHEIRTPINAIMGMTALAMGSNSTAEQRDCLETVQKSAYALLDIINDILDFSKVESGKLSIDIIDFNLRLTIEEVVETLAHQITEKGLEPACLVYHDVPSLLRGDPSRIRQVLLNLGSNAIKFTDKGEVVFMAELKEETDDKAKVLFSVTDTGIGIPEDKQGIIFDEFTQVDGSTTRMHGGTGLGLSISKKLVGMMGGEIGVESEQGKGSRFWFSLTFDKQKKGEEIIMEKGSPDIEGVKVLVVDNNRTNRTILEKMLGGFGCRVESAGSGAEAVKTLKSAVNSGEPFNVALVDMIMPGMDGKHTTVIIKNTLEIRDTSVIILTSFGNRGDVSDLRNIGCAGYLVKPVKQKLLLDVITTVVSERGKEKSGLSSNVVTRHSITERKFQEARILLVDDNEVNQRMTSAILRKAGYTVDVADNGRLAVEAADKNNYDLIFMDIQMPEMDGYEATKAIRAKEGDRHHAVIIAMTAYTIRGDRESCLAAGMDDYLAKPIEVQEMFNKIKKWIKSKIEESSLETEGAHSTTCTPEVAVTPGSDSLRKNADEEYPVEMRSAMSRFGNDREFFKDLGKEFLNYVPEQIRNLEEAVKSEDTALVQKNAHSIKGAAGNLSANKVASVAVVIENMGRQGDISEVSSLIEDLKSEISCLEQFVENL